MLLHVAEIKTNDEVIICTHTMIATASAIKSVGAIPVPIENILKYFTHEFKDDINLNG